LIHKFSARKPESLDGELRSLATPFYLVALYFLTVSDDTLHMQLAINTPSGKGQCSIISDKESISET